MVIELGAPMQDMQQEYAQSRAMSMQDIEKSIGELAGVFAKLGEMVSLQAEQIERIDSNMDEALHHVDQGILISDFFFFGVSFVRLCVRSLVCFYGC